MFGSAPLPQGCAVMLCLHGGSVMHSVHQYAYEPRTRSVSLATSGGHSAQWSDRQHVLQRSTVHKHARYAAGSRGGNSSALLRAVRPPQLADVLPQPGTTHAALDTVQ